MNPIPVETAAFQDRQERPFRRFEQCEILEGVAVDQQEIREGARPQAAELALLPQHSRSDQRRRADDLQRRQHLTAQAELAALLYLKLPEQIAPVGDRYARALADLERAQAA